MGATFAALLVLNGQANHLLRCRGAMSQSELFETLDQSLTDLGVSIGLFQDTSRFVGQGAELGVVETSQGRSAD